MVKELASRLRNPLDVAASKDAADYLEGLENVRKALENLLKTASNSMINDALDETAKGHRLGTVEVCEAILKIF